MFLDRDRGDTVQSKAWTGLRSDRGTFTFARKEACAQVRPRVIPSIVAMNQMGVTEFEPAVDPGRQVSGDPKVDRICSRAADG
jgi:hypothetical protein